ncbi:hypothetical protein N9L68_00090 [bacterium]|nr:hypothetical protein [bacterium]
MPQEQAAAGSAALRLAARTALRQAVLHMSSSHDRVLRSMFCGTCTRNWRHVVVLAQHGRLADDDAVLKERAKADATAQRQAAKAALRHAVGHVSSSQEGVFCGSCLGGWRGLVVSARRRDRTVKVQNAFYERAAKKGAATTMHYCFAILQAGLGQSRQQRRHHERALKAWASAEAKLLLLYVWSSWRVVPTKAAVRREVDAAQARAQVQTSAHERFEQLAELFGQCEADPAGQVGFEVLKLQACAQEGMPRAAGGARPARWAATGAPEGSSPRCGREAYCVVVRRTFLDVLVGEEEAQNTAPRAVSAPARLGAMRSPSEGRQDGGRSLLCEALGRWKQLVLWVRAAAAANPEHDELWDQAAACGAEAGDGDAWAPRPDVSEVPEDGESRMPILVWRLRTSATHQEQVEMAEALLSLSDLSQYEARLLRDLKREAIQALRGRG